MLDKKMEEALNKQINAELYSSYLYLAMAANFEAANLRGFAHWMQVQAREENAHAMKLFGYVTQRGGRVRLQAIEKPPADWDSALAAFKNASEHEQKVTAMIGALVDQAAGIKDHATTAMLQWFVTEQVEEEANASQIVAMLEAIAGSTNGLFMADHQLGKRE